MLFMFQLLYLSPFKPNIQSEAEIILKAQRGRLKLHVKLGNYASLKLRVVPILTLNKSETQTMPFMYYDELMFSNIYSTNK